MTNAKPGLRKRGSATVRGALILMVVLFLATAAYRTWHHHSSVIHVTAPIYEFYGTPDKISCELDNGHGSTVSLTEAYCVTITPSRTQNVRLRTDGAIKQCVGEACGSNAGLGTPTLARGTTVTSGPFRCVVDAADVRCFVASGRGFKITTSAITPLQPA